MSEIKYMPIGPKPMSDAELIAFISMMAILALFLIIGVGKAYLDL